jgi:DNA repair protein RecO (recombination protein O)
MQIHSQCIMLRLVRFSDTRSIATCLVRDLGRIAFLVPDGPARSARRLRPLLMPGTRFDAIVDLRPTRSLQTLSEVAAVRPIVVDNPIKSTILLFVCDVMSALLRDSQPDPLLFDYVSSSIAMLLDASSPATIANAPICFLIGLQHFMGIRPDTSTYSPGWCFDLEGGCFVASAPLHGRFLSPDQAKAAHTLLRMNRRNLHLFNLNRSERQLILDTLLQYFAHHFGSLRNLQSLEIVRSIFN